jgi:glycosyltransferase involved in cell wall biosynthesis
MGVDAYVLLHEARSLATTVFAPGLSPFFRAKAALKAYSGVRASHLFVLNVHWRGGEERSGCSYIRAAAEKVGATNVLVVSPDCKPMECADWIPADCRSINLHHLAENLSIWQRVVLLIELVEMIGPSTVLVFNSDIFWQALALYKLFFRRTFPAKVVAYLGGYEIYLRENYKGFQRGAISRSVADVDLFITDNKRLRRAMLDRFKHVAGIDSKVVCCYKSLTPELALALSDCHKHIKEKTQPSDKKVLWAGRIVPSKRPDVLASIAARMPKVQFELFGHVSGVDIGWVRNLPNVRHMGEYRDFSQIARHDKDALIYTSESDGMPNVLVEAAASGIPIVTSNVGGICELITDETGWLVDRCDDIDGYVNVLSHVLAHPEEARTRSLRAKALVEEQHTWRKFCQRLDQLNIWS